ncbi:MAG: competence/damage-inducible protein A [Bryobacteraceae bacterium]
MQAEIIAIGSELLTPNRMDTNSLFLTEQLNSLGVEVKTKCVVGDERDRLADAVRAAISRSEIVILSGGLGPTEDDVTRDAVADALDRRQIYHAEITEALEQRFRQMNRRMAEINKRQAFVIEGAEILSNDRGTAPGQWVEDSGAIVMLLPGPPHELEPMFLRHCLPRLARCVPKRAIQTVVLRVAGMPESDVDQLISPIYKKYPNPVTTILAGPLDIQVHLRAQCATEAEAAALLDEVRRPIELALGDRIYSWDGAPMEEVVGGLLKTQQATLAVAESCTGGLLAERITTVPGSSAYFLGGFVTYSPRMKMDVLGVSEAILETFGPVSAETTEAMATGARLRAGAHYALAITGAAGPAPDIGPNGRPVPVGTVFVAIADGQTCSATHRQFLGDRGRIRAFAAQMAMDVLRRRLLAQPK